MHDVFITGNIDESKVREEAYRRAVGNKYDRPESTTIHYHPHGFGCNRVFMMQVRECELIPKEEK